MYTRLTHNMVNIIHDLVFILPTIEPDTIAAVSAAKVSSNPANTYVGIVSVSEFTPIPSINRFSGIPINPSKVDDENES